MVEDDQNFGDVLRSYLEMNDYEVTLANDGIKGIESYHKGTFDLCILDVMMPRKDGFTVAKEIREKDLNIPIIFLTGKTGAAAPHLQIVFDAQKFSRDDADLSYMLSVHRFPCRF